MKTLKNTVFVALVFLLCFSCGNFKTDEKFYEKRIVFSAAMTLDEKVEMASKLIPTPQQADWQELEMTAFIHFTVNTFTGKEWGHGTESPDIFNPAELDTRQWVKTLKDAGMRMVILTCKHHDGFCLWPSKTTKHSVAASSWKNGKGDVVKELKEACDEFDMRFGVYLSPWDRNAECYGDSDNYNDFFLAQLTELLTWYGQVDEVWFDGACGEGPNGKKQVYDWDAYYDKIAELQPNAVTAIMGKDIRWVGTESGYGRETEWSCTVLPPGGGKDVLGVNKQLNINAQSKDLGSRDILKKADQLFWYPAEVDVSIRPGWFYHEHEDEHVKSLDKLVDIYFSSVGRNAVLLLNIPPDKRGLINEIDVARLKEFREYLDATFKTNFLYNAKPNLKSAYKAVDDDLNSYWEIENIPGQIEFKLTTIQVFNVFMIQEYIRKGQRVEKFKLEAWINDEWVTVKESTTIGYKKLLHFNTITTDRIRLTIEQSRGNALISNIGLYKVPEL